MLDLMFEEVKKVSEKFISKISVFKIDSINLEHLYHPEVKTVQNEFETQPKQK